MEPVLTAFRNLAVLFVGASILVAQPALAADEDGEIWFGPSFATDIDDDTSVELQTAQRFRDQSRGRADTYYARGWVHQKIADNFTLSGAAEYRINDEGDDEVRVIQQIGAKQGILRARLRLEERFIESNGGRMGFRIRPRVGVRVPLNDALTASADGELFYTARATSDGGSTGLTGVETRVGFTYDFSGNFTLGVKYLRAQSLRDNRPDKVSHAPLFELDFSF